MTSPAEKAKVLPFPPPAPPSTKIDLAERAWGADEIPEIVRLCAQLWDSHSGKTVQLARTLGYGRSAFDGLFKMKIYRAQRAMLADKSLLARAYRAKREIDEGLDPSVFCPYFQKLIFVSKCETNRNRSPSANDATRRMLVFCQNCRNNPNATA